jgi:hypothetical protein
VDIPAAVKASFVGMKTVIRGVASRPNVWPEVLVRETKVVSPVSAAVEDKDSGTVKRLSQSESEHQRAISYSHDPSRMNEDAQGRSLDIEVSNSSDLPVSCVNHTTSIGNIGGQYTDGVAQP